MRFAAVASRHRRAAPNWCMGFWPGAAWRSPAAWRYRQGRTAGHGVLPPKNRWAGRTCRLGLRHRVQGSFGRGVAAGQPCGSVRRAAVQASKRLTQMHSRWTPMHADGTWANAPALLIRIGWPGSAVQHRAGLRPIRVHRRASAVHLRKNSCLLCRPPHRPRMERHARVRHRIMAMRLTLHGVLPSVGIGTVAASPAVPDGSWLSIAGGT